jgi:hypothetical protein
VLLIAGMLNVQENIRDIPAQNTKTTADHKEKTTK